MSQKKIPLEDILGGVHTPKFKMIGDLILLFLVIAALFVLAVYSLIAAGYLTNPNDVRYSDILVSLFFVWGSVITLVSTAYFRKRKKIDDFLENYKRLEAIQGIIKDLNSNEIRYKGLITALKYEEDNILSDLTKTDDLCRKQLSMQIYTDD